MSIVAVSGSCGVQYSIASLRSVEAVEQLPSGIRQIEERLPGFGDKETLIVADL